MYNVNIYTVITQKMIWEPTNFGSFLEKVYLRLLENVLDIFLKIVYEKTVLSIYDQRYKPP